MHSGIVQTLNHLHVVMPSLPWHSKDLLGTQRCVIQPEQTRGTSEVEPTVLQILRAMVKTFAWFPHETVHPARNRLAQSIQPGSTRTRPAESASSPLFLRVPMPQLLARLGDFAGDQGLWTLAPNRRPHD